MDALSDLLHVIKHLLTRGNLFHSLFAVHGIVQFFKIVHQDISIGNSAKAGEKLEIFA